MDTTSSFRQIRILYYRYKDTQYFTYGIIAVIFLVCILQLVLIILPVWGRLNVVRAEEAAVRANIKTIEANTAYVSSLNPQTQEDQRTVVLSALPITKDYAGVYNAIVSAASKTGVSLSNFSYDVGSLDNTDSGISQMLVELGVSGDVALVNNFVEELKKTLPLSSVETYAGDTGSSALSVAFYYGGEKLPITVDNTKPLSPLSAEKQELLGTLSSYMPTLDTQSIVIVDESASGSASGFGEPPF